MMYSVRVIIPGHAFFNKVFGVLQLKNNRVQLLVPRLGKQGLERRWFALGTEVEYV